MSRYLRLDTSKLQEAYQAYFKATVAKGNHMPLDYGRWLEYRIMELQAKIDAALAIDTRDPHPTSSEPMDIYNRGWRDACKLIWSILRGE